MTNHQTHLPNCGPVAVAYAVRADIDPARFGRVDSSYVNDVMRHMKATFNKGARWQGRSNLSQLCKMLDLYGIKHKATRRVSGYSLKRWVDMETRAGRSYIVRTGGHFQFVRGGLVSDQYETAAADDFHLGRKRVTHVIEIIERERDDSFAQELFRSMAAA